MREKRRERDGGGPGRVYFERNVGRGYFESYFESSTDRPTVRYRHPADDTALEKRRAAVLNTRGLNLKTYAKSSWSKSLWQTWRGFQFLRRAPALTHWYCLTTMCFV